MPAALSRLLLTICCWQAATAGSTAELTEIARAKVVGEIPNSLDISGAAFVGNFLAICSDEGRSIQLLERTGDRAFKVQKPLELTTSGQLDLEGIASHDDTLYVVGSHSWLRLQTSHTATQEQNRRFLSIAMPEPERDVLFRLTMRPDGSIKTSEKISLRHQINHDALLRTFREVPSKENGVDIEGIATDGKWLYAGFRGPVVRGSFIPVMKFAFDDPTVYTLLMLDLHGLGVRDLTRTADGFLVIGGPVGDGPGDYRLFYWDGKDCVPGKDVEASKPKELGEIPTGGRLKAESVIVVNESATHFTVLIGFDGESGGRMTYYRVAK